MGNIVNSQEHKADVLSAIVHMLNTGNHDPQDRLYWQSKRDSLALETGQFTDVVLSSNELEYLKLCEREVGLNHTYQRLVYLGLIRKTSQHNTWFVTNLGIDYLVWLGVFEKAEQNNNDMQRVSSRK